MDYIEIIHMDLMGTFPAQSAGRFYSTRVQGAVIPPPTGSTLWVYLAP